MQPGLITTLIVLVFGAALPAQRIDDDRSRGVRMMREIKSQLRVFYYDPDFRGIDLDAHFATVEERIRKAESQAEISGLLAQSLMVLEDSHTYFIPPPHATDVQYGFVMRMVGDRCLVMAVKPDSLAAADGLRAGDQVLMVEGVMPSRENLWQIMYAFHAVRHRRQLRMTLQSPERVRRDAVIRAYVSPPRQFQRFEDWVAALVLKLEARNTSAIRTAPIGSDGAIVRVTSFDLEDRDIDEAMERVRGKRALVLDLRENPGGAVDALRRLAGYFFERPTAIGELRSRKRADRLESAKRPADRLFRGKVVVLVDSASGSAAEVLARALQLTRKAAVIGDRSAGAVMVSRPHIYTDGHEARFVMYGLSITEAALVMADGASLERSGVLPDEVLVPSQADLAAGLDPVLARAAATLDLTLDAKAAGALFPREWP